MVKMDYNIYNGFRDGYASQILNKNDKKTEDDELEIMTNFLRRLKCDYEILERADSPNSKFAGPDCIFCINNKIKVGCEITRYYSDRFTNENAHGKYFYKKWRKFASELKEKLIRRNKSYKNIYGVIYFKKNAIFDSNILNTGFIESLVKVVDIYYKNLNPSFKVDLNKVGLDNLEFIKENVDCIFLENIEPEEHLWWPAHLQSGKIVDSAVTIKNIIKDKNSKTKNYKKDLDQKWLLIFAEGLGLNDVCSTITPLEIDFLNKIKEKYFTNIYIFNIFPTQSITQIYPRYKVIFNEKVY